MSATLNLPEFLAEYLDRASRWCVVRFPVCFSLISPFSTCLALLLGSRLGFSRAVRASSQTRISVRPVKEGYPRIQEGYPRVLQIQASAILTAVVQCAPKEWRLCLQILPRDFPFSGPGWGLWGWHMKPRAAGVDVLQTRDKAGCRMKKHEMSVATGLCVPI